MQWLVLFLLLLYLDQYKPGITAHGTSGLGYLSFLPIHVGFIEVYDMD